MIHPAYRIELTEEVEGEAEGRTYPPGTGGVVVEADWEAEVYTVAVPVEEGAADAPEVEYVRLSPDRFRDVPGVDMDALADYRWLLFQEAVREGEARRVAEAALAYVKARGRGPKPDDFVTSVREAAEELAGGGGEDRGLACRALHAVAGAIPDQSEDRVGDLYARMLSIADGIEDPREAALRRAQGLFGVAVRDGMMGRDEKAEERLNEIVDLLWDHADGDLDSEAAALHRQALNRLVGPDEKVY